VLPGSTDGLTDAQNAAGEDFGDEHLIDCCRTVAPAIDAEGVAERLMYAVAEWSTEQFDDTTVVVVDVAASVGENPHGAKEPANDVAVTASAESPRSSRRAPIIPASRANEIERAV
jgi:hypothetical protein